jgi:hypothetical protein
VIVVGMGLGWVGYALAWYGYSLVKGYDLTFMQLVSPGKFYTGKWPPPAASPDAIFPGGKTATAPTTATTAGGRLSGPSRIAAGQVPGAHG